MCGCGLTLWLGRGYVLHVSTEDGWQFERAEHRTWRVGFLFAVRRSGVVRCAVCQKEPADSEGVFCSKRCLYRYRTAAMDYAAGSSGWGIGHRRRDTTQAQRWAIIQRVLTRAAVK